MRERRRTEMADERRGRPWGRREIWREKNMEKKRQRALMRKQPYRLVEPPCTAVVRFAMRYEIRRTKRYHQRRARGPPRELRASASGRWGARWCVFVHEQEKLAEI